MGLDWQCVVRMRLEDQKDYIHKHYAQDLAAGKDLHDLIEREAPKHEKPCRVVGAKRLKELPDFLQRMLRLLGDRKRQAEEEMKNEPQYRNERFIEYWQGMTLQQLMAENAEKYSCDDCPLLKSLEGADSCDNPFLGVTVASCDFRGKRIGSDGALGELADEAFAAHDSEAMLDYADRLLERLEFVRANGLLKKLSYEKYVEEHNADCFSKLLGDPLLSRAEYKKEPHWREQNVREAVHWLRTCANFGVDMESDY